MKLLWRKCHTCSRSLFFTAAHLHLALVAASISHLTAASKVSCCSSNKKCLLCFLSLALNPCCPFSPWACRPLSLFLSFSCSVFQICGHENLSKLNTLVFIDSFVVSALQDAGGYVISRQNNLKLHLGYHTCWLSYFTLVYLWCRRTVSRAGGRAGGVRSRDYQIFSDGWYTLFSFPCCSAGALRARAPLWNHVAAVAIQSSLTV